MSRTVLPLPVRDVSAFAKALSRQLSSLGRTPGHLELLNMLARSAGFQNFQHLRETRESAGSLVEALSGALGRGPSGQPDALGEARPGSPNLSGAPCAVQAEPLPGDVPGLGQPDQSDPLDERRLKRLLRFFDQSGRMIRWPGKHGQQTDCLWVVWSRLPSGPAGDEAAVNARLAALHTFGDHALLRRELYDRGFLDRTPDGRAYRRLERKPDPLALALIRRAGRGEND